MIRDPSDGSVKEITKEANEINRLASKNTSEEITPSGLPTASTRPQMIAKLEKSREWLKNYHEREGTK
jgi:hypothetical protein